MISSTLLPYSRELRISDTRNPSTPSGRSAAEGRNVVDRAGFGEAAGEHSLEPLHRASVHVEQLLVDVGDR